MDCNTVSIQQIRILMCLASWLTQRATKVLEYKMSHKIIFAQPYCSHKKDQNRTDV